LPSAASCSAASHTNDHSQTDSEIEIRSIPCKRNARREAKRLKALEDENGKLKKLLAETMLDIAILKDINSRKW
jgi:hypothetical protein